MYLKLALMNVSATSFLTRELVDICFWIPLQESRIHTIFKIDIKYSYKVGLAQLNPTK